MNRRLTVLAVFCLVLAAFTPNSRAADPPSLSFFFPATAGQGQELEVTAGGTFKSWPVKVRVEGEGLVLEPAEEKGKFALKVAPDATPGRRLIRLYNEAGASELKAFTVGTLPETAEAEPNDEPTKPQKLDTLPAAISGRLAKRGDVDTFAVELTAGQTLFAALEAQYLGSPMDGVIQLVSPAGFVLEQVDDAPGFDPRLVFHATSDGTFLVRVFAFPATPDSSINLAGGDSYIYRLTLTTGPYLEQVLPLALSIGHETAFDLTPVSANLPGSNPTLNLHPSFRPSHALAWHEGWPGEVELPVVSTLVLREQPPGDPSALPQSLPVPTTLSGHLAEPRQEDAFTLELAKDQEVAIQVEARSLGSPLDPVLRVEDAAGNVVSEQDDTGRGSRDVDLRFKAKQDGLYKLVLTDLFAQGGPRFVYRLTVTEPRPDFGLELKSDRITLNWKEPVKLALSIRRENGFDQPVDLEVVGLPEGVKAASARSEPKGDSAKAVSLELSIDPENQPGAWSGPVHVVGRTEGGRQRQAQHETAFDRISLNTLWLTLPPPPEPEAKDEAEEK